MNNLTNDQKRNLAKALYLSSSLSQKAIAAKVGCTEKTLKTWIDKGGWEQLKLSQTITRSELLKEAYQNLKEINSMISDGRTEKTLSIKDLKMLTDAKAVSIKEIDVLSKTPVHLYVEVFEDYLHFVSDNGTHADLLRTAELSSIFLQDIAKRED